MSAPDRSNSILSPGKNVWKTTRAEDAGILVDAADYYLAFYHAAREAKRTILLSGWQFDRGVPIVRGDDAPVGAEVKLLRFLNQLCERNPELEIYILAWDFHVVFALEREWMQKLYFDWTTNERLRFRFDDATPARGSHHQKFAVIDRNISFLGGIDLCEARWDDRRHVQDNPLRLSRGEPVKPYHDAQSYFTGCDVADTLRELFVDRWARSEGDPMQLATCDAPHPTPYRPRGGFSLGGGELALSRTDPRGPGNTIREIEALFVDAIRAAESLLYIETQYFSSRTICDALIERLRQEQPRLEVVVVLNVEPEAIKEEFAIGLRQAKVLMQISEAAAKTAHALGIYSTLCDGTAADRPSTYIHSKLLIVDDRFLTLGSANLTNRSMGVDTELHASWEAARGSSREAELTDGIRNVRVSLLAEHSGLSTDVGDRGAIEAFANPEGLVARLDALTRRPGARLRQHGIANTREREITAIIDPEALPFDPATPEYEDDELAQDEEHAQSRPLFIGGLDALWEKLKPG